VNRAIEEVRAAADRASRRALVTSLATRTGLCAAGGAGLGLVAVGAAKLAWLAGIPYWTLVAVPAVAGLVVGAGWAVTERWSRPHAAAWLDRTLGLNDRLRSALEFSAGTRDPFVEAAVADAGGIARTADVPSAVPLRAGRGWWWAAAFLGVAASAALWVPQRRTGAESLSPRAQARERERAAEQVRAAVPTGGEAPTAPGVERELDAVRQIERELARGEATAEGARTSAARALERAADAAERQAERIGERSDTVRSALAESARAGEDPGRGGTGISEALKRGDIGRAAEAAGALAQRAGDMSQEERRRAAQELAQLAKDLDEIRAREDSARRAAEAAPSTLPRGEKTDGEPAEGAEQAPESGPGRVDTPTPPEPSNSDRRVERRTAPTPPKNSAPAENTDPPLNKPVPPNDAITAPSKPGANEKSESTGKQGPQSQREQSRPSDPRNQGESKDSTPQPGPPEPSPADNARKDMQDMSRTLRDAARQLEATPRPEERAAPQPAAGSRDDPDKPSEDAKPRVTEPRPSAEPESKEPGDQSPPQEQGVRSTPSEKGTPSDQPAPGEHQPGGPPETSQGTPSDRSRLPDKESGSKQHGSRPSSGSDPNANREPSPEGHDAVDEKVRKPSPSGEGETSDMQTVRGEEPNRRTEEPDTLGQGEQKGKPDDAPDTSTDAARPRPDQGSTKPGDHATPRDVKPESTPPMSPDAIRNLAERFKRLAESSRSEQDQRGLSRELREQARKMLENAHPDDLRRIAEMMRERGSADRKPGNGEQPRGPRGAPGVAGTDAAPPPSGPRREWDGSTELVDARGSNAPRPGEKTSEVSRWSGDPSESPGSPGSTAGSASRVRAAAAGAERAVEQQVVPSRFGPFVKRVFRKYVERADATGAPAPDGAAPALPDAPDARPRGN